MSTSIAWLSNETSYELSSEKTTTDRTSNTDLWKPPTFGIPKSGMPWWRSAQQPSQVQTPSWPGLALIRRVSLTTLATAGELQQPGYLSHSDAAAATVDRLAQRQALVVGHRQQRLPSAPLSVLDQSIAFTERG